MDKKALVVKYRPLVSFACSAHNLRNLFRIQKRGDGNKVSAPCALLKKVRIHCSGKHNTILIDDFSTLKNVSIYIYGDHNTVHIGPWCNLTDAEICMEDSRNEVHLGEHTWIMGKTQLAAIEGTRITIGRDCLFSSDVHFRTGDSHSILDRQGKRINPSEDITLGDHVWVGTKVTCLKGVEIPAHSIVGAGALVTGKFTEENTILAGVPAKIVKRDTDWCLQRIPVEAAAEMQPEV